MRKFAAVALWLAALSGSALAQDFGPGWLDRVTFDMQRERGPLEGRPLEIRTWVGAFFYHDDNVFLEEKNEDSDSVFIPYARVVLEYADPISDVRVDFTANHKIYSDLDDINDDEQRLFVRGRQSESDYSFEVAEVLRRESEPVDSLFLDRYKRLVSDTFARASVEVAPGWSAEATATLQVVNYERGPFDDTTNNNNVRAGGAVIYHTPEGIDLVGEGGYVGIFYRADREEGAPPDVWGYYGRGGVRGEPIPGLVVEALAGVSDVESDYFFGTTKSEEDTTLDASFRVSYEATPELTVNGAFVRRHTHGGNGDPFQTVNRAIARFVVEPYEMVTLIARGQADFVESALGVEREFFTAGVTATYEVMRYVVLDAGVTMRRGEVTEVVPPIRESEFDNVIFYIGGALSY